MADEWACDDCGYITSAEPEAEKCPGCGSKMTKIVGVDDDLAKDKDGYDKDDMETPIDEEDDFVWDELKDDEIADPKKG